MHLRGVALCLGLLLAIPTAWADEVTIPSANPYQMGDLLTEANPVYDLPIKADLRIPDNVTKPVPALVFMHGSGGKLLRHHRYLELARKLGYATLQMDSFGPRGVTSTVGNQTNVTAAMMATDLLRALTFLADRSEIDADKIAVMGSSKGAIAALFASWSPIREKVAGDLDFAGYILLYPLCLAIEDGDVTKNPVHIYIGEKDNWTPAAPCITLAGDMKSRGLNWDITLYEGAYHAFDAPLKDIRHLPHAYSMAACDIALRQDGYEVERNSGFLLTKAERRQAFRKCAKKGGVKMGGSHAAGPLLADVERFLRALLE